MWTDGLVPHAVDAEFWEFATDAFPELLCVGYLGWVLGEVVDVDVALGKTVSYSMFGESGIDSVRGITVREEEDVLTSRLVDRYLGDRQISHMLG
jgi:hypothetical protein